ncbi:MAG: substrate-binding domain-containing protein [Spirochaetaceae bacterium]
MGIDSRLRIAFFTAFMEGEDWNSPLWKSVDAECKKLDIDLIIFPGRNIINAYDQEAVFDEMFEFFSPEEFDGLIFASTSLMYSFPKEKLISIIDRYKHIPTVSLGIEYPGISSVVFDNYKGMSELVEHLVLSHSCNKFGMLNGPLNHDDSLRKKRGVEKALKKYELKLKTEHIIHIDIARVELRNALNPLFQYKELEIDVLICANDTMASEAIDIFKEHGYTIPEDIIITGCDHSIYSLNQFPSITTVDQSVSEMATKSVEILYSSIINKTTNINHVVDTHLILNESCGCKMSTTNQTMDIKFLENVLLSSISKRDDYFYNQVKNTLYMNLIGQNLEKYKNSLFTSFDIQLEEQMDKDELKFANKLYRDIILLFENFESREAQKNIQLSNLKKTITRGRYENLITSGNLKILLDNIYSAFNDNEIGTSYILLYSKNSSEKELEFVYAVKEGNLIDTKSHKSKFSKNQLMTTSFFDFNNRVTLVVLPLFSSTKYFGFLVVEASEQDSSLYEDIQMILSSALTNVLSTKELKETQSLLIESEKMAFLGNLVAGLAHEINTPVGVTVTAASYLDDLILDIYNDYHSNKLTKTKIENFLEFAKDSSDLIKSNIKNTVSLINKFKKISSNTDFELKKVFDLSEETNNIFRRLNKNLTDVITNIDVPEILLIDSYKETFYEIFKGLFINSIDHGFKDGIGEISVKISKTYNLVKITYSDNGIACVESLLEKMFDPFFTTKRIQGFTGLGLTIIYNLIKNRLGGEIDVAIINGQLTFTIIVPV